MRTSMQHDGPLNNRYMSVYVSISYLINKTNLINKIKKRRPNNVPDPGVQNKNVYTQH